LLVVAWSRLGAGAAVGWRLDQRPWSLFKARLCRAIEGGASARGGGGLLPEQRRISKLLRRARAPGTGAAVGWCLQERPRRVRAERSTEEPTRGARARARTAGVGLIRSRLRSIDGELLVRVSAFGTHHACARLQTGVAGAGRRQRALGLGMLWLHHRLRCIPRRSSALLAKSVWVCP
jgi:hypothetical protein